MDTFPQSTSLTTNYHQPQKDGFAMPVDFDPLSRRDAQTAQATFNEPEQPSISIFQLYFDEIKADFLNSSLFGKAEAAPGSKELDRFLSERAKDGYSPQGRGFDNGYDPYDHIEESKTLPSLEIDHGSKK
jgi:hypothetical protein